MYHLSDFNLIGITGHAGSGKDTLASYLYSTFTDTYTEAFADPLKAACAEAFGIPLKDFHTPGVKEEVKIFWGASPRMIAQFVGTEMFREVLWKLCPQINNDFWIWRMVAKITGLQRGDSDGDYTSGDTIVIPDVRFQNEYDWIIQNNGIVFHLTRPGADGTVGIPNHTSEQGIQDFHAPERTYHVNNNGSLEDLFSYVDPIVRSKFNLTPYKLSF